MADRDADGSRILLQAWQYCSFGRNEGLFVSCHDLNEQDHLFNKKEDTYNETAFIARAYIKRSA